jgi:predicted PurR-regulated permease PerM
LRKEWTMLAFKEGLLVKRITIMLIILMSLISVVPRVEAAFIPSGESQAEMMRDQDIQVIKKALENKLITQRLQDLGFSDQEIQDRLDQLSDQEVHNLATQIDSVSQGGILGVVIAVLVIVILVLVILKLMD